MNETSFTVSNIKTKALPAILWGGSIAGAFDLAFAVIFYGTRGVKPIRVAQSIASGLLGPGAYQGGFRTAALGVLLHFVIALGAASVFFLASRKLTFLLKKPILWGPIFGAAIYLFMHLVVLPLAANPKLRTTSFSLPSACDFLCHIILIGPSIAFAVRHFSQNRNISQ